MHRHESAPRPSRKAPPPAGNRNAKIAFCAVATLLAGWAGGATLYILFSDEALKYLAERQVSITRSYETRIAALQGEIDRLHSLKLIDQERVDRALADLARRQTVIETRQSAISALAAGKDGARKPAAEITGSLPAAGERAPTKPTPLSGTILIAPAAGRWTALVSRPLPPAGPSAEPREAKTAAEVRIGNLARGIGAVEAAQSEILNGMEVEIDGQVRRMRKVLADLGLDALAGGARFPTGPAREAGTGGPFLPWTRPPEDPFARQLHRIRSATRAADSLGREIAAVPVRRPTAGAAEVTSGYGMRLDPFLRQPAMHAGVDFRGSTGDEVRAAAGGRVVQAERNGGYGLMVEIDHGNGLATRYAHLSAIAVAEGAAVRPGDPLGRVGSTGRSTGPHLHYEVRLHGEATDPQRFLRAGLRLEEPD